MAKYGERGRYGVTEMTSINKNNAKYSFSIVYDAAKDKQVIQFKTDRNSKVSLSIYSPKKHEYTTLLDADFQGSFEYPWDASQYSDDIHTVRLEINGEVFTKTITAK